MQKMENIGPATPSFQLECQICGSTASGIHFGAEACRACAAFFRRTIVEKKVYTCKTEGRCNISKNVRNICRKCRLQKCLDTGMKVENVQGKRDPILPKPNDPNPLCVLPAVSEIELPHVENSHVSMEPTTSQPISIQPPHLIRKSLENYRLLCSVRKAVELALAPEIYSEMQHMGPLAGLAAGSVKRYSTFFKATLNPLTQFVTNTYDQFSLLNSDEKWQLLRPFLVTFSWVDSYYKTYKQIPPEHYTTVNVLTETTYFDLTQVDKWAAEISACSDELATGVTNAFKKMAQAENMKFLHLLNKMNFRDEEYMAMLGLFFWNYCVGNNEPTANLKTVISQVRASLFEELHAFHRQNGEPNPATRLGEILDLINYIVVEMMRCREFFEVFTILDAVKQDDFFYELVHSMK